MGKGGIGEATVSNIDQGLASFFSFPFHIYLRSSIGAGKLLQCGMIL